MSDASLAALLAVGIGGIGIIGGIREAGKFGRPMSPMIPMVVVCASLSERIGRYAPFPSSPLAREHETCHPRAGDLFEPRDDVLTAAAVWVQCVFYIIVELGGDD
jgi:hypothetical protein